MKKLFNLWLIAFVLSLSFEASYCLPKELTPEEKMLLSPPPEIQRILKRGKLLVALHIKDHSPFFMVDKSTGELVGIDVDMAKKIATALGVEVEFDRSSHSFDAIIDRVALGTADIGLAKISMTLKRAQKILYTKPYFFLRKSLLFNRKKLSQYGSSKTVKQLMSRPGVKIGAISKSSYDAFSRQLFPKAEIYNDRDWKKIVQSLDEGKILAAFRDEVEIRRTMFSWPHASLNFLAVNLNDEMDPITIAVSRSNRQLHHWLNQYIEHVSGKSDLKEFLERYPDELKSTHATIPGK